MALRPHSERILGIDPGLAATGFAVLDRQGNRLTPVWYDCIRTPAGESASDRLVTIHNACRQVIERFEPSSAAVEELFSGAGPRVALQVGQARGVLLLACAHGDVPAFEYSPTAIKVAVTGYGRADKRQVQAMVQHLLGMSEPPKPDHAADAFAAAICHAGSLRLPQGAAHDRPTARNLRTRP